MYVPFLFMHSYAPSKRILPSEESSLGRFGFLSGIIIVESATTLPNFQSIRVHKSVSQGSSIPCITPWTENVHDGCNAKNGNPLTTYALRLPNSFSVFCPFRRRQGHSRLLGVDRVPNDPMKSP